MKFLLFLSFIVIIASCSSTPKDEIVLEPNSEVELSDSFQLLWNWEGQFDTDEQEKLKIWINQVYDATMGTLGQFPFDVHVYFIRSNSENRAVPFGFARRRDNTNQVHFYVNPTASLDELVGDWTAPHEFSHLAIPFLGKRCKWFSEGFATFLSRQTMMDMGYYTQEEFDSLYFSKIADTKEYYNSSTKTFLEVSDSLLTSNRYSSMYWGSSTFLFTIDQRLRSERDMRFVDVLKEYQTCCRERDLYLKDVIRSFDEIIGENWCSDLMLVYRNQPSSVVMEDY